VSNFLRQKIKKKEQFLSPRKEKERWREKGRSMGGEKGSVSFFLGGGRGGVRERWGSIKKGGGSRGGGKKRKPTKKKGKYIAYDRPMAGKTNGIFKRKEKRGKPSRLQGGGENRNSRKRVKNVSEEESCTPPLKEKKGPCSLRGNKKSKSTKKKKYLLREVEASSLSKGEEKCCK